MWATGIEYDECVGFNGPAFYISSSRRHRVQVSISASGASQHVVLAASVSRVQIVTGLISHGRDLYLVSDTSASSFWFFEEARPNRK